MSGYDSDIVTAETLMRMNMSSNSWFYHTIHHVEGMLQEYESRKAEFGLQEDKNLRLAIYYHDMIYVPGADDNEERSAALAPNAEVKRLVLSTKVDFGYKFTELDEQILHTLDWSRFTDFDVMLATHKQIFYEALAREFIPSTIQKNMVEFYRTLHRALKYEGYKVDFFNEERNEQAVKNIERFWKMMF